MNMDGFGGAGDFGELAEARAREASAGEAAALAEKKAATDGAAVITESASGIAGTVGSAEQTGEQQGAPTETNPAQSDEATTPEPEITYDEFSTTATQILELGNTLVQELRPQLDAGQEFSDEQVELVRNQLAVIGTLLETRHADQDKTGQYPDLIILKSKLIQIRVADFKSKLPPELLNGTLDLSSADQSTKDKIDAVAAQLAQLTSESEQVRDEIRAIISDKLDKQSAKADPNVKDFDDANKKNNQEGDEVDDKLTQLEAAESDPDKKEKIKKVKEVWKILQLSGAYAGITLKNFYDLTSETAASFMVYVLNPSGGYSSGGKSFETVQRGNEQNETLFGAFKHRFADYRLMGSVLYKCAPQLPPPGWKTQENNAQDLLTVKDGVDANAAHRLLVSYYETALQDSNAQAEENWKVFGNSIGQELFGKENVALDENSILFLKEMLKNNGEKLREFWRMGDSNSNTEQQNTIVQSTTSTEAVSSSSEVSTDDLPQDDTESQPEAQNAAQPQSTT